MVVVFEEGNIMNKKLLTKTPVVCGLAIICCLLWGSAFPCIKIGYQMFNIPSGAIGSQFLFAGIRFFFAGLIVVIYDCIIKKKIVIPRKVILRLHHFPLYGKPRSLFLLLELHFPKGRLKQ